MDFSRFSTVLAHHKLAEAQNSVETSHFHYANKFVKTVAHNKYIFQEINLLPMQSAAIRHNLRISLQQSLGGCWRWLEWNIVVYNVVEAAVWNFYGDGR